MKHHTLLERTDIWREGTWLDLWSVVHVLSGMSFGFGMHLFSWQESAVVVIVFVLLVAYEMFEVIAEIEETPTNRFMDVVTGMAGFLPVYFYAVPRMEETLFLVAFSAVFVLNIAMSAFGWMASHKAALLEGKLRARIGEERVRLRAERLRLRARFGRRARAGAPWADRPGAGSTGPSLRV